MLGGDEKVKNWGCSSCRGDEFKEWDSFREIRNCDGDKPNPGLHFLWAPDLQQCPWSYVWPESWALIDIWTQWKEFKLLPYDGDLNNQPAYIFEAIFTCEEELKKVRINK